MNGTVLLQADDRWFNVWLKYGYHFKYDYVSTRLIPSLPRLISTTVSFPAFSARISKAKRRKRVTRDMSTLKNSMLELAAKFDDNYNTGLIKSFMFGLNKTEIKTMTDILSRYKFRDSHGEENEQKEKILHGFDLPKIRLQNESQRVVGPQTLSQTKIELKKLLPTFNPEVDNRDLFISLFERQMKNLDLDEDL
ncbi:uncharacterized protein TNCV_5048311 [Trichonephila clavipes]|nr:uncharacterized protein TNCV_5048311 [Trichonephila clavipes]